MLSDEDLVFFFTAFEDSLLPAVLVNDRCDLHLEDLLLVCILITDCCVIAAEHGHHGRP